MDDYRNLPQSQRTVQRLVDRFNADERRWRTVWTELLNALQRIGKTGEGR